MTHKKSSSDESSGRVEKSGSPKNPDSIPFDPVGLVFTLGGLSAAMLALMLIIPVLPSWDIPLPTSSTTIHYSAYLILFIGATVFFVVIRKVGEGSLSSLLYFKIPALVGLVVLPSALPFSGLFSTLILVVIGIGFAALISLWVSNLFLLDHSSMVVVTAFSLIFSAVLAAVFFFLSLEVYVVIAIASLAALLSVLITYFIKYDDVFRAYPFPKKRRTSRILETKTVHSIFSTIGLEAGFVYGYAFGMNDTGALGELQLSISLVIALGITAIVLLVFRDLDRIKIERHLREYNAFYVALGLFLLLFLPGMGKMICLIFLLAFTSAQAILSFNSMSEWARFDRVSPFWYSTEAAPIAATTGVGLLLAGYCVGAGFGESTSLIIVCAVILVLIFMQVSLRKVRVNGQNVCPNLLPVHPIRSCFVKLMPHCHISPLWSSVLRISSLSIGLIEVVNVFISGHCL